MPVQYLGIILKDIRVYILIQVYYCKREVKGTYTNKVLNGQAFVKHKLCLQMDIHSKYCFTGKPILSGHPLL